MMKRYLEDNLIVRTLYGLTIVFLFWEVLSQFAQSAAVPTPLAVLLNCFKMAREVDLGLHIGLSMLRLSIAGLAALLIGTTLGLMMGLSQRVNTLLSPVLYIFFPIPKVALLPILFIFLGLGERSKILLLFLILVFQIVFMVRDAISNIPESMILSARSMSLSRGQLLRHLYLPSLSKTLLSALRLSVGTGIAVLFFAENYATQYGLGFLIMNSWSLINYLDMYSGIVFLSLLGALLFGLLDWIENRFCQWHY